MRSAAFGARYPDFIDYLLEKDETRISLGGRDELIALLWLLSSMWWFQLATDGAAGVDCCVSCDEGFSQRGLSLLAYREEPNIDAWERSVREYFQCMPKPDTVVVPLTPFEVALDRMALRHQGYPTRVRGLSPSKRRRVLERADRCVQLGTEQLCRRGVVVIRLENGGSRGDLRRSVDALSPSIARTGRPVSHRAGSDRFEPRVVMFDAAYPPPFRGGKEKQAHLLSCALRDLAISVRVLTLKLDAGQPRELDGIEVTRLSRRHPPLCSYLQTPGSMEGRQQYLPCSHAEPNWHLCGTRREVVGLQGGLQDSQPRPDEEPW